MTTYQIVKFGMFKGVEEFGIVNSAIIDPFPTLKADLERLSQLITEIRNKDIEIQDLKKGKLENRDSAKEDLINSLTLLARLCQSYALNSKNYNLYEIVSVSESELRHERLDYLGLRAADILGSVNAHSGPLVPLGVTEEMLSEAGERLIAYNQAQAHRKQASSEKSAKMVVLENLFKDVTKLLDENIDKEMLVIRDSNPAIFNEYKNARKLKNYPATHATPEEPSENPDTPNG